MERTRRNKQADAILMADAHLREDKPLCRVDDFQSEQWRKMDFISRLQKEHECIVLNAGDLFHHWKPSPHLLTLAIEHLPDNFYTVYGQHELPQHNMELAYKSGTNTLSVAGELNTLIGSMINNLEIHFCSWNGSPRENMNVFKEITKSPNLIIIPKRKILVWHVLTYHTELPHPRFTGSSAQQLLRKHGKNYDLIVTGDNHKSFVVEYDGSLLVNPGSMMRTTADQMNFEPRVYLWYADMNTIEAIYLPIKKGVVSRAHIERAEQHSVRLDAFISRLSEDWKTSLSFEDNLKTFGETKAIRQSIMDIIWRSIETAK